MKIVRTVSRLSLRVMLAAGVLVVALAGLASPVPAFDDAAVLRLILGFGFERDKDEVVSVPDNPKLDFGPTDEMTLSVLVKLRERPETYHILGKRDEGCGAMNYQLARDSGGLHFNSEAGRVETSVPHLPLGVWTHIRVTYANFRLTIYVNGRQVGSAHSYELQEVNDAPLVIGGSADCSNTFPGRIGSTSIYRQVWEQNDD